MGFLKHFFNKETLQYTPGTVYAPLSGAVIPLEDVPDPVFSSGMLGKGIGIEPERGMLLAPADGQITLIAKTKHAIGLTTSDGAELLLHIGLDTVDMRGEGFLSLVSPGEHVSLGQKLMRFDLDKIRESGHSATVLVVVTNADQMADVTFDCSSSVRAGEAVGCYRAKTE